MKSWRATSGIFADVQHGLNIRIAKGIPKKRGNPQGGTLAEKLLFAYWYYEHLCTGFIFRYSVPGCVVPR